MEKAVFGGGCFWCTEAIFKMLKGVRKVSPGYAGGAKEDALYEKVSTGHTGHAEVTSIDFDPSEINYHDLLTVFFATHDPTTVNRQGDDVGPQYRSIIFYTTPGQKEEAERFIKELDAVTELEPLKDLPAGEAGFYEAEDYHKDYFAKNQSAPYCQIIINPKLEKVQKEFAELLKKNS